MENMDFVEENFFMKDKTQQGEIWVDDPLRFL